MAVKKKKKKKKSLFENKVYVILLSIVVLIFLSVTVYEIYTLNNKSIATVTAYEQTIYDSLEANAFVIRDEEVISSSFGGYVVPFVEQGEKVSSDAQIAISFSDENSAENYTKIKYLQSQYDRYKKLSNGTEYSALKVESLSDRAKQDICQFIGSTDSGNISQSSAYAENFLDDETALHIAINGNIDLSENMLSLSSQIKNLKAAMSEGSIITTGIESSGYYYSTTDGLENEFVFDDVKKIKPEELEKALEKDVKINEGLAGKIIKNHVWYLAFTADFTMTEAFSKRLGKSIRIEFPELGIESVVATVHSVNHFGGKTGAVILRCTTVSEELLALRKAKISVIFSEKTGFKIPSSAVRIIETDSGQERGVYILRGNVVTFRKINAVYSGEDFILSEPTEKDGYITLYDEIITGGKELYDGALVYQ